jgi:histidine ammonia-lyase
LTVVLTGSDLTVEDLVAVARRGAGVELGGAAVARMAESRRVVEASLAEAEVVYGFTTGVGSKKLATVAARDLPEHNRQLLLNHRVGQGPALPGDVVRGALVRLANHLALGVTAARPELAQALVEALNSGKAPVVRSLGSIGTADLSANADLAYGALDGFELTGGEAIALLNHNSVSSAHAALALTDAAALVASLDLAAALDFEGFAANITVIDPEIARVRPYRGQEETREQLARALEGSFLFTPGSARNLQDPLCFRCVPQVHGAARDALRFGLETLEVDVNAHQSNPLVVAGDEPRIISVGNFDATPVAVALDLARIALAPVLTAAGERTVKMLQRPLTDLPEGLAVDYGIAHDGLAEFGIAVQAIVSEARLLAQPVSFELSSVSQAEGIEDRATSAPLAARRLAEQVDLGCRAAAIELLVGAQAVDLRSARPLGRGTSELHRRVRALVPALARGASVAQDLEPLVDLVRGRL